MPQLNAPLISTKIKKPKGSNSYRVTHLYPRMKLKSTYMEIKNYSASNKVTSQCLASNQGLSHNAKGADNMTHIEEKKKKNNQNCPQTDIDKITNKKYIRIVFVFAFNIFKMCLLNSSEH